MAVQITQSLNTNDMAYGPNFITLGNIGSADKFGIRIKKQGTTDVLALVGQAPNAEGRAIFDLQKIFQSYVAVGSPEVEQLGAVAGQPNVLLHEADLETYNFLVEAGSITGSTFTADFSLPNRLRWNGTKAYHDLQFDFTRYQGDINADDSANECTEVSSPGKAFTRWHETALANVPGTQPPNLGADLEVYMRDMTEDEAMTIAWYNELDRGIPAPTANAKSIEAFEIAEYNASNTLITRTFVSNIQANGGGPNTAFGGGDTVVHPYHAITMGVGPRNLNGATYTNTAGVQGTFNLNANTKYYWVVPRALTPLVCDQGQLSEATHNPIRINLVDADCLNYDYVQFSWLNQFGFRDYYTFKARNEIKLGMQRNEYLKNWTDWAGTEGGYGSGAGAGVLYGGRTTFNQAVNMSMTASTDYISDDDAKYLNGLWKSPNVRVRILKDTEWVEDDYDGNQRWQPCIIKSNNWTERNYRKDRLFQYDIQFEMAHPINIQHG